MESTHNHDASNDVIFSSALNIYFRTRRATLVWSTDEITKFINYIIIVSSYREIRILYVWAAYWFLSFAFDLLYIVGGGVTSGLPHWRVFRPAVEPIVDPTVASTVESSKRPFNWSFQPVESTVWPYNRSSNCRTDSWSDSWSNRLDRVNSAHVGRRIRHNWTNCEFFANLRITRRSVWIIWAVTKLHLIVILEGTVHVHYITLSVTFQYVICVHLKVASELHQQFSDSYDEIQPTIRFQHAG